jgi:acetyl esterase/lipase
MDRAALDAAYNNTLAVGEAPVARHRASWKARSDALRALRKPELDLRYGSTERERLDFWPGSQAKAPTLVFIHGGYWQMNDKEPFSFIAEGPLAHGINVALVEYTLAPAVRMDRICAEIRRAVDWLLANLARLGGDPAQLYVSGHSAGGHLTAIAMAEPRLAGGIAISGLFDLEPIRLNYLNDKLQLDPAEAARNSPIKHLPTQAARLVVTVGANELPELVRQSAEYAQAWAASGLKGSYLPLAGHDHFSILEALASPTGALTQTLRGLIAA